MNTNFGFVSAILKAAFAEQLIMFILLILSIISWAIMYVKWRQLKKAHKESQIFLKMFWDSKQLDSVYENTTKFMTSPLSHIFRSGYLALAKSHKNKDTPQDHTDDIERSMKSTLSKQRISLESLIAFLATTGSTAPFIGLLGTVLGIISAFQKIGIEKSVSLDVVAPGIGGALVATAFGLFAAIPAVVAYNYFVSRIRLLDIEMNNFLLDFLNIIKRHSL